MVNQLPQGWKEEELGKLADVSSGDSAPQSSSYFLNGIYPFCRTSDVGKIHRSSNFSEIEDYINETAISKLHLFRRGTILFPKSGASTLLNHRVMLSIDSYVSSHLATIYANSIDRYYLYYFLCTVDAKQLVPNIDYPSLKISELKNIKVPYPTDKGEQDYIVKTLDTVAEMIKLRKETIQLTKDLIPAIFQEMFGDCSENVLIGNNDYFEIEDGDRGNNYPKKEELLEKGDCLFLSAKNVTEDGFVFKENVFISQDKDKKLRTGKLKRHDFVMMTRGTIGNIAYYAPDIPYDNIRINSGMVIIRIKQGFEPLYFLQAMRSDNVKFQINNLITGAAVPQLPIHLIKKISLKLADNTKQKEFAEKVEQINDSIIAQQEELEQFETLFQSLLQEAFTGVLTWNYPRKECHDKKDK